MSSVFRAAGGGVTVAVLVGVLLAQLAWALTVPPFRGSDEHDHAYKAAAVAGGDWSPRHEAPEGVFGELVTVPPDLVKAANPVCEQLLYTTDENCSPIESVSNGNVTVASSASRYNPAFYWYIGSVAEPFSGAASLYAMRAATAVLSALLIALALLVTRRSSLTRWPQAAVLLAITPVFLYSTTVAAPNGIELASALLLWAALLALVREGGAGANARTLVVAATIGAVLLTTVRTLGPLWLLLILACFVALATRSTLRVLGKRRDARWAAVAVTCCTAAGLAWSLAASTNSPVNDRAGDYGSAWPSLPINVVLWMLQSIAAFPLRNEPAPTLVYAISLTSISVVIALGVRHGNRRERATMGSIVLAATAIPVVITIATFAELGAAWQGRYGLPLSMGLILLCGHTADGFASPIGSRLAVLLAPGACIGAGLVAQLRVLAVEIETSPLAGSSAWVQPSAPLLVALALASALILAWGMARGERLGMRHGQRAPEQPAVRLPSGPGEQP